MPELLEPELPEDLELPELERPDDLEFLPLDEELLEGEERPELLMVDFFVFDFFVVDSTFRFVEDLDLERITFLVSLESFFCLITFLFVDSLLFSSLLLFRLTNRVDSLEVELVPLELPKILLLGEFLRVLDLLEKFLFSKLVEE